MIIENFSSNPLAEIAGDFREAENKQVVIIKIYLIERF